MGGLKMILTKHLTFVLKLELNTWASGKWGAVRVGGFWWQELLGVVQGQQVTLAE